MTASDIHVALACLDKIDIEVEIARDIHAKAEHAARVGPTTPHWLLNSPPGHLSMADQEYLRQLQNTVEVVERCRDAAALARELLALQQLRQLEDAAA